MDVVLLVVLAIFAFRGYRQGLVREAFALGGLLVAWLVAGAAGGEVGAVLVAEELAPEWVATPAAYVLVFVAVVLAARLVGFLVSRFARVVLLGGVDRLTGTLFGALKGAAVLGFVLLLAERFVPSPALERQVAGSTLGRPLVSIARGLLSLGAELAGATAEQA